MPGCFTTEGTDEATKFDCAGGGGGNKGADGFECGTGGAILDG